MPEPRLIRHPRDAEIAAAEWLRYWGFADARTHGPGADAGIDVESLTMVAQVKARVSPAGRPELQQLHGAAVGKGKQGVFFSIGGFTAQAVGWANDVGLPLFAFDLQGEPTAVNGPAFRLSGQEPPTVPGLAGGLDGAAPSAAAPSGAVDRVIEMGPTGGSLPSPVPVDWQPGGRNGSFVKYARRLQRNGHPVTGYAVNCAETPADLALVQAWADVGVVGSYVVVDHQTGRVEGYPTWAEAYAATCAWDGGKLAPSVQKSFRTALETD